MQVSDCSESRLVHYANREISYPYGFSYPYGLGGTEVDDAQLKHCFTKRFVLLLGSKDTDTGDKNLRKTPEANAQGPHRFARGKEYTRQSRTLAKQMDVKLKWRIQTVRNVGHSNSKMAPAAAKMIR